MSERKRNVLSNHCDLLMIIQIGIFFSGRCLKRFKNVLSSIFTIYFKKSYHALLTPLVYLLYLARYNIYIAKYLYFLTFILTPF